MTLTKIRKKCICKVYNVLSSIAFLFLVKCNFQDGLCGMKHESKIHQWRIGSGSTPTKNTGPCYDHTTFLPAGE